MIGNTANPIELLFQQIHKGQQYANKLPVRKIYIDEDPAKDQMIPCPRCSDRNQQNMVRYLFVNLSEAIYKCEAYDCMYPFRNFKFKNFEECTVYRYELQSQHDVDSDFVNILANSCNTENTIEYNGVLGFNMEFLSCEGVTGAKQQPPTTQSFQNPSTNFDTGFIDEILEDLFPSSSNPPSEMKKEQETESVSVQVTPATTEHAHSPCNPVTQCTSGRKLEKCLKVFEKPHKVSEDDVFKKPKAPKHVNHIVEHITPTKLRIKRVALVKNKAHNKEVLKRKDRTAKPFPLDIDSNGTLELKRARALVKSKKIKPLDLLCKLNTMTQQIPTVSSPVFYQPLERKSPSSAKVQRMLNFIQRSMKTSDGTSSHPADRDDKPRCSYKIVESDPPVPASFAPLNTENSIASFYSVELVNEPNTAATTENHKSEIPSSSPSGGMDMLFHFME